MEVFHKFYNRLKPLAEKRIKDRNLSAESASLVDSIADDIVFAAVEIYRRDIMKDKHGLDLDLTKYAELDDDAGESFKQRFTSCEICGQTRTVQQCHIIPRSSGGANKTSNYLILCANHHHLFDHYRLTKFEWDKIKWSEKAEESGEYAKAVRLPRQEIHWKHIEGGKYAIEGCSCGNMEFKISFIQEEGDGKYVPACLQRVLTCQVCGNEYGNSFFQGYEYEWWWQFILEKARNGELLLPLSERKEDE